MNATQLSSVLFVAMVVSSSISFDSHTQQIAAKEDSPFDHWLDGGWQLRYVLFVDGERSMQEKIKEARRVSQHALPSGQKNPYRIVLELLEPRTVFTVQRARPISTFPIWFDSEGRVKAPRKLDGFTGKHNELDDLALVDNELDLRYFFANWSYGGFADVYPPAVCTDLDYRRYSVYWMDDGYAGKFGCREWRAQLDNPKLPYIDVTTYGRRHNYIGEFLGWSRYADPPKPVIGQHGKTWLCLHECPIGEKPGAILDIKAWTVKHGFPMPKRPPKQPMYPNQLPESPPD